jgi:hypothetical protein
MRLSAKQFQNLFNKKSDKPKIIAGGYTSHISFTTDVGGQTVSFKSLWEYNYACYLQFLKEKKSIKDWEYEPIRFSYKEHYERGPYDYLPDYRVTHLDGSTEWHEVKGYMNSKSRSKIKRFEKHFKEEGIVLIIDKEFFKSAKKYRLLIPGWLSLDEAKRKFGKTCR